MELHFSTLSFWNRRSFRIFAALTEHYALKFKSWSFISFMLYTRILNRLRFLSASNMRKWRKNNYPEKQFHQIVRPTLKILHWMQLIAICTKLLQKRSVVSLLINQSSIFSLKLIILCLYCSNLFYLFYSFILSLKSTKFTYTIKNSCLQNFPMLIYVNCLYKYLCHLKILETANLK